MPEVLSRTKERILEFWKGLDKSQKTRIYITAVILIIAVVTGVIMSTRPDRITLISSIDPKQAGEMSGILNENSIWNSVENNGSSIVINSKDNNKAQIALAQKGYPKEGLTFEDAINMIGISTTESDKKHIWKQQQISDIEAKIKMLDNVDDASVSLALPERTIWVTEGQEMQRPTAYVMIKPIHPLSPQQVQGIVMILSRSVEGLNPKDVTVVDNNSIILNNETGDDLIERVNSQEDMRLKKAKELQKRVYDYFSVGQFDNFDTLRVVANPYLDFDKLKQQKKTLNNPQGMDEGAVVNSDILKETVENASSNGVPGTDTNPGNTPSYQVGDGENSSYKKQQEKKNYAYNETLSEEEKATGVLIAEKSTMAIALWYGNRVNDDSKLSQEFLDQVALAASTATGIPVVNIAISKYKMAQQEKIQKPTSEVIKDIISDYGFFALMLLLVMGLIIAAIPGKRRSGDAKLQTAQVDGSSGPRFVLPENDDDNVPEINLEERSEIKKQIDKFVKQRPEAVAQLLRNWLSDDWDD